MRLGVLNPFRRRQKASKPVIVVSDDDPGMRDVLRLVLSRAGCEVRTAANIDETMVCLLEPNVSVAVLDMLFINSGGRSGLDVLEFIRKGTRHPRLPVIVLTGFTLNPKVLERVELHGAELWHKPPDFEKLAERISEILQAGGEPRGTRFGEASRGHSARA